MANPDHLKLIKQGVGVWNVWRRQNKTIQPDLSGARLRNFDLRAARFEDAILTRAFLIDVNLSSSRLRGANLNGAKLTGANLYGADLRDASLVRAQLSAADLGSADLRGANLTGAQLEHTVFENTLLTDADGLADCMFLGPCTLDPQTVASSGAVPKAFIRGCGWPEAFIESIEMLRGTATRYHSCFISYSSKDEQFARLLHADLQKAGVRCWFAPEDMRIGDKIVDTLDRAIRVKDKVLLILSESAISSDWVEDEVTRAFGEERNRKQTVLFPVRLTDEIMDTNQAWAVKLRENRHIGDFTKWNDSNAYQSSLSRVLRDLEIVERPA